MRPASWFPLVPALVVAAALAVRLLPWAEVYGGDRVRLTGDSDAHYHVLRAERLLTHAPGAPWRDPTMNWPYGAVPPVTVSVWLYGTLDGVAGRARW